MTSVVTTIETVVEDGEQLDVTPEQAEMLLAAELIYACDECGSHVAHVAVDRTMDEVETMWRMV